MLLKRLVQILALYIIYATNIKAQVAYFSNVKFTQADTLRGMLRPERTCYDVTHYELSVFIDIDSQRIIGNNKISYNVIDNFTRLQIDLFENLVIDSIIYNNKILDFERKFNAVFITTPEQTKGTHNQIVITIRTVNRGLPLAVREWVPAAGGRVKII